jgi:hypothetical protein
MTVRPCASRVVSESGMALIAVLLLLLIVSAATAALAISGQTESMIAANYEMAAQAQAAAEAGMSHAVDLAQTELTAWQGNGFASAGAAMTSLLLGPDGLAGTAGTDADNGSLETLGIPRTPGSILLTGAAGTGYQARLFDEDDPARGLTLGAADLVRIGEDGLATANANTRLVIQATGFAANGVSTTIEATLDAVTSGAAGIVSGGSLTVTGSARILGTNGGVHANVDLDLDGDADVAQDAVASGDYTQSGSATVGGMASGGEPLHPITPVAAIDHQPGADYILKSDGTMRDQANTIICDASGAASACEDAGYLWTYMGPTEWRVSTNVLDANGDNKTYYLETDATITGSPGNAGDPLNITIIAEGDIDISGHPTIEADTPGLLFVTDEDLQITGNLDQLGAEAQILIHEQFSMTGNGTLFAAIVIEDAAAVSPLVTTSQISGTAAITSNGGAGGGVGPTRVTVSGWREL